MGRVYKDWEDPPDSGDWKRGIDPETGLITVHNYTPYNLAKGAARSNNVADAYKDYTPEYDAGNKEKWTECAANQVILQLSHLIPLDGNPVEEPTATDLRWFKLPTFAKNRLRDLAPAAEEPEDEEADTEEESEVDSPPAPPPPQRPTPAPAARKRVGRAAAAVEDAVAPAVRSKRRRAQ